jgi:hypothetical protein
VRDRRVLLVMAGALAAALAAALLERRLVPDAATRAIVALLAAGLVPFALALAMGRVGWSLRALVGLMAAGPGVALAWFVSRARVEYASGSGMLAAACVSSGLLLGAKWVWSRLRGAPGSTEEGDKSSQSVPPP